MTAITIDPTKVAEAIREEAKKVRGSLKIAARAAAYRLKAYLIEETDRLGITDRGIFKNSFVVSDVTVINEAPHAGMVEMGTRPHHVGREGREALKAWCMRKLGLSEQEAEGASWAIAQKIAAVGTTGRFIFRDSLPKAYEFFQEELLFILAKAGSGV